MSAQPASQDSGLLRLLLFSVELTEEVKSLFKLEEPYIEVWYRDVLQNPKNLDKALDQAKKVNKAKTKSLDEVADKDGGKHVFNDIIKFRVVSLEDEVLFQVRNRSKKLDTGNHDNLVGELKTKISDINKKLNEHQQLVLKSKTEKSQDAVILDLMVSYNDSNKPLDEVCTPEKTEAQINQHIKNTEYQESLVHEQQKYVKQSQQSYLQMIAQMKQVGQQISGSDEQKTQETGRKWLKNDQFYQNIKSNTQGSDHLFNKDTSAYDGGSYRRRVLQPGEEVTKEKVSAVLEFAMADMFSKTEKRGSNRSPSKKKKVDYALGSNKNQVNIEI